MALDPESHQIVDGRWLHRNLSGSRILALKNDFRQPLACLDFGTTDGNLRGVPESPSLEGAPRPTETNAKLQSIMSRSVRFDLEAQASNAVRRVFDRLFCRRRKSVN